MWKVANTRSARVLSFKKAFELIEIVPREVDVHFLKASIFKCYIYELLDFIAEFLYSNKTMVVVTIKTYLIAFYFSVVLEFEGGSQFDC